MPSRSISTLSYETGRAIFSFSPASIATALGMTYAGARGDTAAEMAKVLHFTLGQERLHPALGALLHDLGRKGGKPGQQLTVANALWSQKGHKFLPEFMGLNRAYYGAGLEEVDFAHHPEQARRTINAWVAENTRGKIQDLIGEDSLHRNTRLVLSNAVYFKGDWESSFAATATKDAPFFIGPKETVEVPLMHKRDNFGYLATDSFQALELPYTGGRLSMVVLLPEKTDGLPAFEKTLTATNLATWLSTLRHRVVDALFPRFKIRSAFRLEQSLKTMGMGRAFTESVADFSGMDATKELFLDRVIHKAIVEVNEKGTEAAAATSVGVEKAKAPRQPERIPIFRADHPFIFLIRHAESGVILFIGRVVDPRK